MSAIDQFDNAAFSEQQQRSRCDISSSRMGPPGKAHRVLGAITLVLAAGLLFLILIPSLIPLLLAWCVVEVLYWMLVTCPTAKQLDAQPAEGHWPPAAEKVDLTHFNRFLKYCREAPGRVDYQKYLTGWFLGADINSIKRGNIEEFAAYGFCYKSREQLAAEGHGDLPARMTRQLEEIWDIECPPGYNPDIKFMAHLWEPLNGGYRPLAFYLLVELVAYCSRQYLDYKGFQQHRHAGINYYTLDLQAPAKTPQQQNGNSAAGKPTTAPPLPPRAGSDTAAALQSLPNDAAPTMQRQNSPANQDPSLPPLSPSTVATAETAADSGPQQQLQPIQEQPTNLHQHTQGGLSQGEQLSSSSCNSAVHTLPLEHSAHSSTVSSVSELSETDLALLESPFALSAASPEIAAAVAAGVISAIPEEINAKAAAKKAAADSAVYKRTKSLPATAAAAAAAEADARQQQLQQRASCSVLQRRLTSRSSTMPPHKMKPLQAALSQALSEAGVIEAGVTVVFLHGIGGLPAYLELLHYLEAEGSPLLAVEVKSVAMRLGPVYPVSDVATAVLGMMDKMGVKQACFVAHSYGTFVASYIAKQHPKRMRGCVLIDPVCLGMFMPNLIYNFLYKKPVWQGWSKPQLSTYVKAAVRRFVSTEVHVKASVARRFFWTELCAWPEDLPAGSTILLSGKDDLMDSPEVEAMLRSAPHLKVQYNEMLTHGAFLLNKEVKQAIRLELQALLATSGSAVAGLARQLSTLVHPAAAAAALPSRASVAVRQVLRKVQSLHPGIGRASSSTGESPSDAVLKQAGAAGGMGGERAEPTKPPVLRSYSEGHGGQGQRSRVLAAAADGALDIEQQQQQQQQQQRKETEQKQQQQKGKEPAMAAESGDERQEGKGAAPATVGEGGGKQGRLLEPAGDAECDVAAAVPDQQQ